MDNQQVIGIDPSLSATGFATASGTYTVSPKPSDPRRLMVLHVAVYAAGPADLAVIEDLPTHAHGAGLTGMAQGVIRLALIERDVPFAVVPPSTLKKFATGKGTANKADMRMELFKRAGIDLRDDNQVDAWWLRQIGLHLTGHPDALPLPLLHTDALQKVKRP